MTQSDIINNNFSKAFECIKCSNAYDTGAVLSEEKLFKQISERKHSTFDLSKFTVVGSPTITDDGIASGFSGTYSTEYIKSYKTINTTNADNMRIEYSFTIKKAFTKGQMFLLNYGNSAINGNPNVQLYGTVSAIQGTINYNASRYTSWEVGDNFKVIYDLQTNKPSTYTLFKNDVKVIETSGSCTDWKQNAPLYLYGNYNGDGEVSVDLPKFSITVDGEEVFNGNKTGLDVIKPDNFEVVGSPVISEDGVASGFDSANANNIQIPTAIISQIVTANTWKVEVGGTVQESGSTYSNIRHDNLIRYDLIQLNRFKNGFLFVCCLDEDGTIKSRDIPITFSDTYNGKAYKATLEFTGTKYISTVQFENGKVLTNSLDSTYKIKFFNYGDKFELGYKCINGSIDLNAFKIYVDGNLVYQPCLKIPYTQSKTGSKIVDVAYRDRVIDLYEQEGKAKYYTIDEPNKNFTLPMGEIYGMIENIKNTKSGGSGLEIGDISTALYVNEAKNLRRYLNGQIVDNNKNTKVFIEDYLLGLYATNPEYFATEENWQSEALLNIDGCVYKFVLNYSGETVVSVRLPKYPDYVEINAGGTLPVVGNGMTLGITNGSGTAGFYHYQANTAFVNVETSRYGTSVGGSVSNASGTLYGGLGVTTDPTKSGIQTTLKQTKLKLRYFIQIATGQETENNIVNDIELNNPYSLFDSKYSDHELNNLSWLKSEGQWNAKAVYPTAYDKLLKVYNGTETVEGLSVVKQNVSYMWKTVIPDDDYCVWTKRRNVKVGDMVFGYNPMVIMLGYIQSVNGDNITCTNSMDNTQTSFNFEGILNNYDVSDDYDFVLNTADETFRLPLLNGSENLPSQKFDNLTLTSSDSIYIAPANGRYYLKMSANTGQFINMHRIDANGDDIAVLHDVSVNNLDVFTEMEVSKGDKVRITHNTSGNVLTFKFIYAQGNGSLYYYVGETVQNANLIDAGRIGEELATKTDMLQASGAGMPSSRYIDLTLGASGTTYTAPANGYIHFVCHAQGGAGWFSIYAVEGVSTNIPYATSGGGMSGYIPIIKGQKFGVFYGNIGVNSFRFIYAEGSK